MTSKLKCPVCAWCNQPMVLQDDIFVCANTDCSACAESFLHKALIQAKQDLAKAINVIDTVRQHKRGTAVIYPNDIAVYCDRALEQIEQKENQ